MSDKVGEFVIQVEQIDGYEFRVRFDKPQYPEVRLDEPYPLGKDTAPNAVRMLAATVANCLSASLVFCMKKKGVTVQGVMSEARVELLRNERKRIRIGKVEVTIRPKVEDPAVLADCLGTFEDFCVVTQSVRDGLDVQVKVLAQ